MIVLWKNILGKGKMTTQDIILIIKDHGGFDNFRNWNRKEIALWVKINFNCSTYIAERVAQIIV